MTDQPSAISLIVGLGNPGAKYQSTRHNAGFWFLDAVARRFGASFRSESKFSGEVAKVTIDGQDVWLLKPDTFMNLSGRSIKALSRFYRIEPEQILVAHDELDLPPGTIRLKKGGGHGGHNGLRDSIAQLGTKEFNRLRIGIGHPGQKELVHDYVLTRASRDDEITIERAIDQALEVVSLLVRGDMQKAMNDLHGNN